MCRALSVKDEEEGNEKGERIEKFMKHATEIKQALAKNMTRMGRLAEVAERIDKLKKSEATDKTKKNEAEVK